jgi:predicted hydrocarbon binding protein/predicted amino acid-binding ACT domain protein
LAQRETGPRKMLSKELLVGRIEAGQRLAQVVVTMKDKVGAVASVNALIASLNVDIRQSMSYSLPDESLAIYNTFVVFNDPKVSLVQLVERLEDSTFVTSVQAHEGRDGVIVDENSFPVSWEGRRTIILSQTAAARMFEAIRFTLGSGGDVVLYQQGSSYGKELAESFVARLGGDYLKRNFDYTLGLLAATGWGVPEIVGSKDSFPNINITLRSCLECEGVTKERPVCSFMRGFLAGVSSAIVGHTVHCEEIRCIARKNPYCEFALRSGKGAITR